MGNLRKIKNSINRHPPRIAMADAHIVIGGCRVFMGHPDPNKATASAQGFKQFFAETIMRASVPNMTDVYNAHFQMREGLKEGKDFVEIIG